MAEITLVDGGATILDEASKKILNKIQASTYKAPQTGLLCHFPPSWVPYAQLIRIDKPLAILYLYFPCLFGTCMAASISDPIVPPQRLMSTNLVFILGCFLVRSAGCAWNDIIDQDIDRKVSRTRNRPLARRAISTAAALTFTVVQVVIGLGLIVLLLPFPCLYYSVPSTFLTALYPFAKRFTYYPQLILGCVFSWGVIIAFPALQIDLVASSDPKALRAALLLYLSCIAWTMSYDTIYSAQDIKDDLNAAVKSPVVKHRDNTRLVLWTATGTQIILLIATGFTIDATGVPFQGMCLCTAVLLGREITSVDLGDPKDCLWWFRNGCIYTGLVIGSGFVAEYIVRLKSSTGV
ncbi:MAG: hypothetical protein Q9225_007539 [Loekoesia sp. 1 TL-2023]